MKKHQIFFLLFVSIVTTSIAQINNQNNNSLKTTIMNFKNVKTQSINGSQALFVGVMATDPTQHQQEL